MRDDIQTSLDGFNKELEEADRTPDDEHIRKLHVDKDKAYQMN